MKKIFFCLLSIYVIIGCDLKNNGRGKESSAPLEYSDTSNSVVQKKYNPREIEYNLPNSNYSYVVYIDTITTKVAKNAFETKDDEYSVPRKVDGYYLTVQIAITNPYDKEMMAPVPDYYYITTPVKKYFSASTTRHRNCACEINNSTKMFTEKGVELWKIVNGKCGGEPCVKFNANETKRFKILFSDPIYGEVRELVFWGFNKKLKKQGTNRDRDIGLLINVDEGRVISTHTFDF